MVSLLFHFFSFFSTEKTALISEYCLDPSTTKINAQGGSYASSRVKWSVLPPLYPDHRRRGTEVAWAL